MTAPPPSSAPSEEDKRNKAEQISESRNATVQQCCSLAEGVLMGNDENDYQSDWSTFEPDFLRTVRFRQNDQMNVLGDSSSTAASDFKLDWNAVPLSLHPTSGQLDGERAGNKEKQVEALLRYAIPMVNVLYEQQQGNKQPIKVIEFGSGSGHLGLLLAFLQRTKCHVTLLERKEYACQQARQRAEEASLTNVTNANTSLHAFADYSVESNALGAASESFQLGISLHSCGVLTDAALALCLHHRAAFCLCPCCYGQTAANLPADYLPRSHALKTLHSLSIPQQQERSAASSLTATTTTNKERRRRRQLAKTKPFYMVARSADCTSAVDSHESFVTSKNFVLAKRCMQIVDADRLLWAQQHRYVIHMASLRPLSVTPKNNLIIGVPNGDLVANKEDGGGSEDVDLTAVAASAGENADAEAGEKAKTGQEQFRDVIQQLL